MSVWQQTGERPKELDNLVELPAAFYSAWKIFIHLHNARTSSGFGINPIPYSEIEAYCRLMNEELEEWEVSLIREFDSVALAQFSKEQEKVNKSKTKK